MAEKRDIMMMATVKMFRASRSQCVWEGVMAFKISFALPLSAAMSRSGSASYLCKRGVVRLGREVDAEEGARDACKLLLVKIMLSHDCLVPSTKQHLGDRSRLVDVDVGDPSVP